MCCSEDGAKHAANACRKLRAAGEQRLSGCADRCASVSLACFLCSCLQPKNYLDFITNYKRILSTQRKEILDTTTRLSNGLTKLTQVSSEVDVLQQELSKAKVVVEAATRECNQLLEVSFTTVCRYQTHVYSC